ncbi:FAD-dependent monooxygenase [Synechococcus sp. PCC 7335]|uniref:FAD-dependent monooxygenase n=1 Tax=Synechococcus sp. (strain ATCC 29403 / PCC 7335) TaxID=91464 RepID=UPI0002F19CD6|nr:FAD-dependent monooxygenase [Synechococcus sp. PCC 7335]
MKHIAIAGAGPAGVATALLLAQQGLKVTLVEQEPKFDRFFRGEGLMPSGLEALYQMGLKETFSKIPSRRLDAWDFYVGGRRRMRVKEPILKGISTQIFNQTALLEAMVEKAKALPNFEFCPGWQVVDFLCDRLKDTVTGLRVKKSGQSRDISADGVIGADGRYSRVRKLAGLTLNESPTQFDVLWFKLPAPPSLKKETPFVACLQPDSQFAFYPSWDGRLQIGWIVEKGGEKGKVGEEKRARLSQLKDRDWIERFAAALPPKLAEHFRNYRDELEGPIFLDVQVGCCEQWSIPGLLLIGDAAHPMAPNRAQGINMALRDAIVVANHLAQGANRKVSNEVFGTIQSERQPEVEAVQKMQLAEWRKVEFISRPGLPYQGFKAIASTFGRFEFAQKIWLHEQKGLREGVVPVNLNV